VRRATGPVVVGPEDDLAVLERRFAEEANTAPRTSDVDLDAFRSAREQEACGDREQLPLPLRAWRSARDLVARLRPAWGAPAAGYSIPFDLLTSKPHPKVHVALLPVREHWQVPQHLRLGGWNECPDAAVHAAMMREWGERFGAEVVCANFDTLELRVARPPRRRDEARKLAREHYLYCSDIVEQGVGSVEALALALLRAPTWYFWWD
jgi:Domain of unknown function (DUF4253)